MTTFKLTIEYDGTDYHGWQVQPGMTTIQGTLQEAVKRIVGKDVHVMGAGRTDAGVHALGQVASLRAEFHHPPDTLRRALTSVLPPDIVVTAVAEMDDDFHAQHSAQWKRYRYSLLTRPYPSAIKRRYTFFVPYPLQTDAMTDAARSLVGSHDFSAFQAAHSSAESPVRTVLSAEFTQQEDQMVFEIVADGFLRHMIRIIMGTLLDVGRRRLRAEDLHIILEGRDRNQASKTISPHGLCLLEVGYHPFSVHPIKAPAS
jgi:tRNA pseudouridine38-40 synthase